MPRPEAPFERFLRSYEIDRNTGCWNWLLFSDERHYPVLKVFGIMVSAHRFSYQLYSGPIPDGMHILHSCDNKRCVNPDHLRAGTHAENMREAADRGLMRRGEAHPHYGRTSHHKGIRCCTAKPVRVLGKVYGSQNEAERALGLGSGTIRYWIIRGTTKANLISREEYFANAE